MTSHLAEERGKYATNNGSHDPNRRYTWLSCESIDSTRVNWVVSGLHCSTTDWIRVQNTSMLIGRADSAVQGATTHLAVMGRTKSLCCTSSTSTWSSVLYLRTVLEQRSTWISSWLWGANMPDDGVISNSLGVTDDNGCVCESARLHTDGSWPSPGTCRWNIIGTNDRLLRVQVRLATKPTTPTDLFSCVQSHEY